MNSNSLSLKNVDRSVSAPAAFAIAILTLLLLAGCGSDSEDVNNADKGTGSDPVSSSPVVLDRSASILGGDGDNDGVRDDVQEIVLRMSLPGEATNAALGVARSYQAMLKATTEADSISAERSYIKSIVCMADKIDGFTLYSDQIRAATFNTEGRFRKLIEHETSLRAINIPEIPDQEACA